MVAIVAGEKLQSPPFGSGHVLIAVFRYCSKECQAKDWGAHKSHCKRIRLEHEKATADSAAAQESLGKITLEDGKGEGA